MKQTYYYNLFEDYSLNQSDYFIFNGDLFELNFRTDIRLINKQQINPFINFINLN